MRGYSRAVSSDVARARSRPRALRAFSAPGYSFDALQWVLLQANVPDELRGRVIGAWVWAIGFGWAGHLGLGALGDVAGVEAAVVTAGVAVMAVALAAGRLRRV